MKRSRLVLVLALISCTPPKATPPADPPPVCDDTTPRTMFVRFVNLYLAPVAVRLDAETEETVVAPLQTRTIATRTQKLWQTNSFRLALHVRAPRYDVAGETSTATMEDHTVDIEAADGETVSIVAKTGRIDSTPARISTNMTIARQTPKRDFGDRVKAGFSDIESVQGIDLDGDCVADIGGSGGTPAAIAITDGTGSVCATATSVFVQPFGYDDAIAYPTTGASGFALAWDSPSRAGVSEAPDHDATQPTLISSGNSSVVLTRPLASVYLLNAHPAGVAVDVTLGAQSIGSVPGGSLQKISATTLARALHEGPDLSARTLSVNASSAAYASYVFTTPDTASGVYTGPCRPPYLCDFLADFDTLLVVGDATDASARIRRMLSPRAPDDAVAAAARLVLPVSALEPSLDVKTCFTLFAGDDTCVMGVISAAVSSVSQLGTKGGGAASAAYARATSPVPGLLPPATDPAGLTPRFRIREVVAGTAPVGRAFDWAAGAGLNASGFAVIASGGVAGAIGTPQRSLILINTSVEPWTATLPILSQ
ncbi:MAG: hypothetical protein IT381_27165 [Deltaproteobacteria bacterium]|nr:hypothetical protein [Deltaproteobacteria bacterium]